MTIRDDKRDVDCDAEYTPCNSPISVQLVKRADVTFQNAAYHIAITFERDSAVIKAASDHESCG